MIYKKIVTGQYRPEIENLFIEYTKCDVDECERKKKIIYTKIYCNCMDGW